MDQTGSTGRRTYHGQRRNQGRRIRQLIVMSLIPNFLFQPLAFLLPVFTTEVLHRGAGTGGLLAAAIGGGGIVAAVIISSIGYVFRNG